MSTEIWDCHFHVFEDARRYPFAEGHAYTPARRSIGDYWSALAPQGVARAVLVQPSVYGFDNRLLLDLLDADARLRGVAVVPADTDRAALSRLHARGVRGIRINSRLSSGLSLADGVALAPGLAWAGLHLQVHPSPGDLDRLFDVLDAVEVPVVLDHMGMPDLASPEAPRIRETLLRLLDHDRFWLKLSAPYKFRVPFDHERVAAHALALSSARPDRMLWGSDWPHPEHDLTGEDTRRVVAAARGWFADGDAFHAARCRNPLPLFA